MSTPSGKINSFTNTALCLQTPTHFHTAVSFKMCASPLAVSTLFFLSLSLTLSSSRGKTKSHILKIKIHVAS